MRARGKLAGPAMPLRSKKAWNSAAQPSSISRLGFANHATCARRRGSRCPTAGSGLLSKPDPEELNQPRAPSSARFCAAAICWPLLASQSLINAASRSWRRLKPQEKRARRYVDLQVFGTRGDECLAQALSSLRAPNGRWPIFRFFTTAHRRVAAVSSHHPFGKARFDRVRAVYRETADSTDACGAPAGTGGIWRPNQSMIRVPKSIAAG
jgi:hypothetical protein